MDKVSHQEITEEERPEDDNSYPVDPRTTNLRWVVVLLASFLVFGNDYCYDLPQALQTPIQEKFGISEVEFNLLYSVYSLPNILLPFIGGYILDYFGIKAGVLLYNILIITGQVLFTIGCYTNNYQLLIIGRSVFGTGAESLNVAQSTIVTMWFRGKELSTALGISLCICRLGSSLNSYLSPLFFEKSNSLGNVSFIGLIFIVISLLCGFVLIRMDSKYLKGVEYENNEKIELKDIKKLKLNFWTLYMNAILCFMSFFSFLNISNKYLQQRFSLSPTLAGGLLVIPYSVAGILTPILSIIIDKKGKKATLLIVTCLILSFNHFSVAELAGCSECLSIVPSLILFGIFFAFYTSLLIPCISIIAEERVLGTAMGIIYSGQNTGLAIGPLIVGSILKDESRLLAGYKSMSYFLGGCAFMASIAAVANWWLDMKYHDGMLQKKMSELESPERKSEIEIGVFISGSDSTKETPDE